MKGAVNKSGVGFGSHRVKKEAKPFSARTAVREPVRAPAAPSGPLKIYLDDERPCPQGWTPAKTAKAFWEIVDAAGPGGIERIALDWYLGPDETNGEKVAVDLAARMAEDPEGFSSLKSVSFHSSDRDRAVAMARTVAAVLHDDDSKLPYFDCRLGAPSERWT